LWNLYHIHISYYSFDWHRINTNMTINKKSCSSDYSPMQKSLPVENGGKTVTIFTDPRELMDSKVKPSGEEDEDQPCAWRSCQPKACQRFRRAGWMLFWLCWAGAIQVRKHIHLHLEKEIIYQWHNYNCTSGLFLSYKNVIIVISDFNN